MDVYVTRKQRVKTYSNLCGRSSPENIESNNQNHKEWVVAGMEHYYAIKTFTRE